MKIFNLKSSWISWMKHLIEIGGCSKGINHCLEYGDLTIIEGLKKASSNPDFKPSWFVWAFITSKESLTLGVRIGLIKALLTRTTDDCNIGRCRKLFEMEKDNLTKREYGELINSIFKDNSKRYTHLENYKIKNDG